MQLYVGNLSNDAKEDDIKDFFHKLGHIRTINVKQGFAFVEFEDERDVDDAIFDYNGRDLMGRPVRLEKAHGNGPRGPNRSDGYDRSGGRGYDRYNDRRGDDDYYRRGRDYQHDERDQYRRGGPGRFGGRYSEPRQTRYRLTVENLSTHCSWQDLKDMMRKCGEVTFADAHKAEKNVGFVCFDTHEGLRRAMREFDGHEINGRRLKLIDDTPRGDSRSPSRNRRSRSQSPRGKKRSYSPSPDRRAKRDDGSAKWTPVSRSSRSSRSTAEEDEKRSTKEHRERKASH